MGALGMEQNEMKGNNEIDIAERHPGSRLKALSGHGM